MQITEQKLRCIKYRIYLSQRAILNRTYGAHENLYSSLFLQTIFGPINNAPPAIPVAYGNRIVAFLVYLHRFESDYGWIFNTTAVVRR